jgi:predicted XRE-type DNA-binding protein
MATPKPTIWIGSSRDDLRAFPDEVRRVMGFAINDAQNGDEHPRAKALKGFGGRSVLEIVDDDDGNTYRAALHRTLCCCDLRASCLPKEIEARHRDAQTRYRDHQGAAEDSRSSLPAELRRYKMSNKKVTVSSGNVFADLGFANPEEELLKAKLVGEIRAIIKRRKLTQTKAAAMLGLKQPDVSALVSGRVGKFSIDRLIRCLNRMDYRVDVVVRQKPRRTTSRAIAA